MKGTLAISAAAHVAFLALIIVPAYRDRGPDTIDVINVSLLGGGGGGGVKAAAEVAAPEAKEPEPAKESASKMSYKPPAEPKKPTTKKTSKSAKTDKSKSTAKAATSAAGKGVSGKDSGKGTGGKGSGGGSGGGNGPGIGPGSGAGIKVDNEDFRFAYYLEVIRERIGYNWAPPTVVTSRSGTVATVYFKISRDGQISDEKIEKTSDQEIFDRAALRAIKLADPLPPLPAGFKGKWLGVHFEFQHTPG